MQEPKPRLLISKRAMQQIQLSTDRARGEVDRNFEITFPDERRKLTKDQGKEYDRICKGLKDVRDTEIGESKSKRDGLIEREKDFLKGLTKRDPRDSFAIDGLEYQEQLHSTKNQFETRHEVEKIMITARIPDKSIEQIAYGLVQGYEYIDMVPDSGAFIGDEDTLQKMQERVLELGYDKHILQGSTGLLNVMQNRGMIDFDQRQQAYDSIDRGLRDNVEQPDLTAGEHLIQLQFARHRVDNQQVEQQRQHQPWGARAKPQKNIENEDLILKLDDEGMPVEQPKIGKGRPLDR